MTLTSIGALVPKVSPQSPSFSLAPPYPTIELALLPLNVTLLRVGLHS
jgi:hypothetical protein